MNFESKTLFKKFSSIRIAADKALVSWSLFIFIVFQTYRTYIIKNIFHLVNIC